MEEADRQYYEALKKKIAEVMLSANPALSKNIEDWKGNDILKFQEDLNIKVNAYISEKSFYNHFKTSHDKLPRIDLLNILSRYAGYIDWSDFRNQNRANIISFYEYKGSDKILFWMPFIAVLAFIIILLVIKVGSTYTYTFCLEDRDTHEPILTANAEIYFLDHKQPSSQFKSNSPDGCFQLKTGEPMVRILVRVPFYIEDTITCVLNDHKKTRTIQLKADDYALMLNFLANSMAEEWESRREKLQRIIADSAYICQVYRPRMSGIELYNKAEFIDLLTMPTASLKHMKILEVLYKKDEIITIRFYLDEP